jgi:4-amino-4-deoxy-L-arabinose transferase-like glycosyltransferase
VRRAGAALVLAATALLYLHGLGRSPLLEPDEGRYASLARSILTTGDWIVPRLNGVVYPQKPPLGSWVTAAAFRVFGQDERSARLGAATAGIATVAVTLAFGAATSGRAVGLGAAGVLATMPLFFVFARLAILDVPFTFWVTVACAALFRLTDPARPWAPGWAGAAGLALAGAVLTKGLAGLVLPLGVATACAVVERRPRLVVRLVVPALVGVLLALPWFLAAEARVPGFLEALLLRHHLARFAVGGKIGHAHYPGYLVPIFLAGALPWTIAAAAGAWRVGRAWWRAPERRTERWCVVWMLVVLGFFSASRLQIATYVAPALPPLAIITARLWPWGGGTLLRVWGVVAAFALVVAAVPAAVAQPVVERVLYARWWEEAVAVRALLLPAAAIVTAGAALGLAAIGRGRHGAALVACGGTLAVALALVEPARAAFESYRGFGTILRARNPEADRIVAYGKFLQGLPFYARRRSVVVGPATSLEFGVGRADARHILWSERRLVDDWNGRRRLFLIIRPKEWRALKPRLVRPATVVAAEHGRVLLTNAPLGLPLH